jgi:alkylmercury lyase
MSATIDQKLTALEKQWEAAAPHFFVLSPEERHAALVLIRELAKGEPVSPARFARVLDVPVREAQRLLNDSHLTPMVVADGQGRVTSFWGLATTRTHHKLELDHRTLWAWCAQDTLFLPALIGETARIESRDPESGEAVHLTISPGRIEAVSSEDVVVSMIRPESETTDLTSSARIIATVCHFVFFFASRASGERWVANHPEMTLLSLDDAFAFGKRQNTRWLGVQEVSP